MTERLNACRLCGLAYCTRMFRGQMLCPTCVDETRRATTREVREAATVHLGPALSATSDSAGDQ